jgi:integrase
VRRKLNQILKNLNLAPAGLHAFRHGRVSVLQTRGVPGDLVKDWVGHSSLKTTSIYTHFNDDFRQRIASEVGLFNGAFALGNLAGKLPDGPNGPNFPSFAVSAGAL